MKKHINAQIATTHRGCRGWYIRWGDQEMFGYCLLFLEAREQERTIKNLSIGLSRYYCDRGTTGQSAHSAPFIKSVGSPWLTGRQHPHLTPSALASPFFWYSWIVIMIRIMITIATVCWYLPCFWHCPKCFSWIPSFNPHTALGRTYHKLTYFVLLCSIH